MVLFWVSFVITTAAIGAFIYFFVQFKKNRDLKDFNRSTLLQFIACYAVFVIGCVMCGLGIKVWNNFPMSGSHLTMTILGSLFFGVSFFALFGGFTIYFYKPDLEVKHRKIVKLMMHFSIPFALIFFIMTLEAYSYYTTFPLISGMSFNGGIHFMTEGRTDGFTINWYGVIILTGAIVTYLISDHNFYKQFNRHGIVDTLFIVSFLFGIFGARLWYCVVLEPGTPIFDFGSGGLAIMGGVLLGATAGIIFMLIFRRYVNIRMAMDFVIPGILIAQAIGRWGNFFNHEVYGSLELVINDVWWIPNFIKQQMATNFSNPVMMYLPLFLIESITNLIGYFVIVYGVGKPLKKRLSLGDLSFLYISWYGLTRVILEPLRYGDFEYGNSYITAWVMFGGGFLAIIAVHLYDYFRFGKRTFNLALQSNDPRFNNPKNPYYVKPTEVHETVKN